VQRSYVSASRSDSEGARPNPDAPRERAGSKPVRSRQGDDDADPASPGGWNPLPDMAREHSGGCTGEHPPRRAHRDPKSRRVGGRLNVARQAAAEESARRPERERHGRTNLERMRRTQAAVVEADPERSSGRRAEGGCEGTCRVRRGRRHNRPDASNLLFDRDREACVGRRHGSVALTLWPKTALARATSVTS
jgi:hypothetical protein